MYGVEHKCVEHMSKCIALTNLKTVRLLSIEYQLRLLRLLREMTFIAWHSAQKAQSARQTD